MPVKHLAQNILRQARRKNTNSGKFCACRLLTSRRIHSGWQKTGTWIISRQKWTSIFLLNFEGCGLCVRVKPWTPLRAMASAFALLAYQPRIKPSARFQRLNTQGISFHCLIWRPLGTCFALRSHHCEPLLRMMLSSMSWVHPRFPSNGPMGTSAARDPL